MQRTLNHLLSLLTDNNKEHALRGRNQENATPFSGHDRSLLRRQPGQWQGLIENPCLVLSAPRLMLHDKVSEKCFV